MQVYCWTSLISCYSFCGFDPSFLCKHCYSQSWCALIYWICLLQLLSIIILHIWFSCFRFFMEICCLIYMQNLELSSIWALLAAFEDPLPIPAGATAFPFEGAFVKGVDSISWMANNTGKLLGSSSGGPHCWTFLSTTTFGKQNKVPQVSKILDSIISS